ncbi:MAG: hypothetical protein J3K34DRAFT_519042 [Monoraphidium minutum]|nr:MAG: hypothetical protein J3K34DRAFT_519042 [Monoraphidium minutum]
MARDAAPPPRVDSRSCGGALPVPPAMAKAWKPYGVGTPADGLGGACVYLHENVLQDAGVGGELMVSTLVAGPPEDCLLALTHPASGSGPLGPGGAAVVLREGDGWQDVCLTLQPPQSSAAALLCAPRCAVARLTRRLRPDGVHLLLFSSLPRREAARLLARARALLPGALGGGGGAALAWRPVLVALRGGYSAAQISGGGGGGSEDGEGSEGSVCGVCESMLTGIFQVDFGGWLAGAGAQPGPARAGLRARVAAGFLEPLLAAVPLAKREVETGRVRGYPPLGVPRAAPAPSAFAAAAAAAPPPAPPPPPAAPPALASAASGAAPPPAAPPPPGALGGAVSGAAPALAGAVSGAASSVLGSLKSFVRLASRTPSAAGDLASAAAAAPAARAASAGALAAAAGAEMLGRLDGRTWRELHVDGAAAPFRVRGPRYLEDRAKVAAGAPEFRLAAVDIGTTPTAVPHIGRFLPCVRYSPAAFSFVVNMMVPTSPDVTHVVMVFSSASWHPSALEAAPREEWTPFQHALHRFLQAGDTERSNMLKMIPHVERGSWVLKQTVGTTPVIMGRKLATTYHVTDRYVEVDIDVSSCKTAGYIIAMVRGITTSLTVDLAYLLEGQAPCELPESLLGCVRLDGMDLAAGAPLDTGRELPLAPRP